MSKTHKPKINQLQLNSQATTIWVYVTIVLAVFFTVAGAMLLFRPGTSTSGNMPNTLSQAGDHGGLPAPDFNLPSLTGEMVTLSDYQGQVVLVNMWATWCPPCKAEMPGINAYYEAHKDEGFVVLAVNSGEDAGTVAAFIQATGFSFPVALDTQGEVSKLYRASGLPTSYIIDRNGQIQHIQTGAITEQQLEAIVEPLL